MPRKTILCLCPTDWDRHCIQRQAVQSQYSFLFHGSYAPEHPEQLDVLAFIEETVQRYRGAGLAGVISTHDYPGSILSAVVASRLGLAGPRPASMLRAQHKLHSRQVQAAACPEVVPAFFPVEPEAPLREDLRFPLFIKPVKSVMSILACQIDGQADLDAYRARARLHLDSFVRPFNTLWRAYGPGGQDASLFIGEEPLAGSQVTVEGFRACGVTCIAGIVDSVMFPGTLSFRSFEYPSRLPATVLARMTEASRAIIEALDLDDLCFNIEFFYDELRDRVMLIEVNPRMSYQFTDLFEKVDGTNTFDVQLTVATGETPSFQRGAGRFGAAVSFVLRRFEDAIIRRLPTETELAALCSEFPDAHIQLFGRVGERLSAINQDMQSFRYGVINLGGFTREHAEARCRELASRLPIGLEPCNLPCNLPYNLRRSAAVDRDTIGLHDRAASGLEVLSGQAAAYIGEPDAPA